MIRLAHAAEIRTPLITVSHSRLKRSAVRNERESVTARAQIIKMFLQVAGLCLWQRTQMISKHGFITAF